MEAIETIPDLDEGAFRRASDAAVVQALASDDIGAIARTAIQEYLAAIEEGAEAGTMTVKASQPQRPEFLKLEVKPLAELSPEEAFRRGFHNGQANLLQMLWGAASYGSAFEADAATLASLFRSAHSLHGESQEGSVFIPASQIR